MKILIVNPNSTANMTTIMASVARQKTAPATSIIAKTSAKGPASIEGYFDEATSLHSMLQTIHETPDADAVIIGCFDDTGLDAARCLTDKPVIGIGEAGFRMASMLSNKFSVVTTLRRSVPALEHNLRRYGLAHHCIKVRASDMAVLALEEDKEAACNRVEAEILRALHEDQAEAVVLGCAGMAEMATQLSTKHGFPILDGVACAVAMAESMVRLGLRTSRLGGYAPPPADKLKAAFYDLGIAA